MADAVNVNIKQTAYTNAISKLEQYLNDLQSARDDYEAQERQIEQASIAASNTKRQQVGTGSRNEKIRTYNYHDSRVVDHRLNIKTSKLKDVMNGDLSPFYNAN